MAARCATDVFGAGGSSAKVPDARAFLIRSACWRREYFGGAHRPVCGFFVGIKGFARFGRLFVADSGATRAGCEKSKLAKSKGEPVDDVGVDLRTRGGSGALASSRSLKCLMALVAMEEGNIIYLFSCQGFRSHVLSAIQGMMSLPISHLECVGRATTYKEYNACTKAKIVDNTQHRHSEPKDPVPTRTRHSS